MSQILIRIPAPLRRFTGGAGEIRTRADDAREALANLGVAHPGILERILDEDGQVRGFVNLYLGEINLRALSGLDSTLDDGDVLSIVPAVAGGAVASRKDLRLQEIRKSVPEISPPEARRLQDHGAVLLDVREADEVTSGSPAGAVRIVRGFLELRVEEAVPDAGRPVLVMCAGGVRSLFAARDLQDLGYRDVRSVAGGFNAWKLDGLPIEVPRVLGRRDRERYGRHVLIPEVGEAGQVRLLESKVLLVGAGGLGSPAAYYLAAAGVGTLGIVDDDVVERSNLQRQILHDDASVGEPKVDSAERTLRSFNPDLVIQGHRLRLRSDNVEEVFRDFDLVLDGSDNFPTRYLVNDACVKLGIPNVHGSIFRFEGQVSVFWPEYPERRGPCYRCLFPEPPPADLAPSCAEAGVLGVLPGVVGTLEAVEAIKVLLGIGEPLVGRLLLYDALQSRFTVVQQDRDPACRWCGDRPAPPEYVDYERFCAAEAAR